MKYYIVKGFSKIRILSYFCWFVLAVNFIQIGPKDFIKLDLYKEWLVYKENPLFLWYFSFLFFNSIIIILTKYFRKNNWIEVSGDRLNICIANAGQRLIKFHYMLNDINEIKLIEKRLVISMGEKVVRFSFSNQEEVYRFLQNEQIKEKV